MLLSGLQPILSFLILALTFVSVLRRVDTRLALLVSGFALVVVGGQPAVWFSSFLQAMAKYQFLTVILPAMGFAMVMKETKCFDAFLALVPTSRERPSFLVLPVVTFLTFVLNTSLLSAAACGALVGGVAIPALTAVGVRSSVAAAAVLVGAWGAVLSPASTHANLIAEAKTSGEPDTIGVLIGHSPAVAAGLGTVMVVMLVQARIFRFHGDVDLRDPSERDSDVGRAGTKARLGPSVIARGLLPILPLILILATHPGFGLASTLFPKGLPVLHAVAIPTVLAYVLSKRSASEVTEAFFDGMGKGYGSVIGILIAALVFIAGLNSSGVTDSLVEVFKVAGEHSPAIAFLGTLLIALFTGSGDAAAVTLNATLLPHASVVDVAAGQLGSLIWIGAEMGRCLSPIAAVTLALAAIAKVDPKTIVRWTFFPVLFGSAVVYLVLTAN